MTPYGTNDAADAYHTALGNTTWTGSAELKTAARLRATLWLDRTYRSRFPGNKVGGRDQENEWPRENAVDSNGDEIAEDEVPIEIEQATYEAALRELVSPGSLAPDYTPAARIKREKKKLGALEKEIEYMDGKPEGNAVTISAVDALLTNVLVTPVSSTTTVSTFLRG